MTFLVFQLRAPLSSFGSSQGGSRLSDRQPRKSALTGLLAAALGIRRDEPERFSALVQSFSLAVATLKEPYEMVDFHTVQAPIERMAMSRAAQVDLVRKTQAAGKPYSGTIVTRREYLQDGHWVVCLHTDETQANALKQALERPQLTLYVGRKSCVLSKFTAPLVIEADTAEAAIEVWANEMAQTLPGSMPFMWEPSVPCRTQAETVTRRNDVRTSLSRNTFVSRTQHFGEAVFQEGQR